MHCSALSGFVEIFAIKQVAEKSKLSSLIMKILVGWALKAEPTLLRRMMKEPEKKTGGCKKEIFNFVIVVTAPALLQEART